MSWKVVPLSKGQLLDVRPEDILEDGLYRRCKTYRGGGGYDQFPYIAADYYGGIADDYNEQFIVQLKGCNLDCPYCYVTRAGVWGKHINKTTYELVEAFRKTKLPVFHLMGGAPALQMKQWPDIINKLPKHKIFHSDIMLSEGIYDNDILDKVSQSNCLYAINIKGLTSREWVKNTRKDIDWDLFYSNWRKIQNSKMFAYITFTGINKKELVWFWRRAYSEGILVSHWKEDSFVIDLIEYDAAPHVDEVAWGL